MSNYDSIIIGAGHNGLTFAAQRASKGKKVLVLEKQNEIGGVSSSREFHSGFKTPGILFDSRFINDEAISNLNLQKVSKKNSAEKIFVTDLQGNSLVYSDSPADMEGQLSAEDLKQFKKYRAFIDRIKGPMLQLLTNIPPHFDEMTVGEKINLLKTSLSLRAVGKKDLLEILRVPPMAVGDWVTEWFENSLLKSALAFDGVMLTQGGPWSPGTTLNLLVKEMLKGKGIEGDSPALVSALKEYITSKQGEVRTGQGVKQILVDETGQAYAVQLESGDELRANHIISSCDPISTFTKLVAPEMLDHRIEHQVHSYRSKGSVCVLNFALKDAPVLKSAKENYRWVRILGDLNDLEKTFDPIKYGECGENLSLEVRIRENNGKWVCAVLAHYVPYVSGGKNEEVRKKVQNIVESQLTKAFDGFNVEATEILTPFDLEQQMGLSGGHLNHGEHATDQIIVRPFPDCARYETPIKNLYLCGSGSFPGGNITCLPGYLASKMI